MSDKPKRSWTWFFALFAAAICFVTVIQALIEKDYLIFVLSLVGVFLNLYTLQRELFSDSILTGDQHDDSCLRFAFTVAFHRTIMLRFSAWRDERWDNLVIGFPFIQFGVAARLGDMREKVEFDD